MKKQILILAFLVLAIFASVSNSYGQLVPHTINCLPEDALHPVSGKEYTYQIDVPVTPTLGDAWVAGSLKYTWFVTQLDLAAGTPVINFITAGSLIATVDVGDGTGKYIADVSTGTYNVSTAANNVLKLTWKNITYDATKPLFVVISVVGDNGVCLPENMKVFKIVPIIAFTVDIDNLTNLGAAHTAPATGTATADYGDLYSQCVSNIVTATWNDATSSIIYDYGINYMYYEVIAANWSDSWNLGVNITGVQPLETITVEWSKDVSFVNATSPVFTMAGPANSTAITDVLAYTNAIPAQNVTATAASGNITAAGERIYIRVKLDHSVATQVSYQALEDQEITLSVDGMTNWDASLATPAFTIGDVHWNNTGTAPNCAALAVDGYTNDKARQDVKARPTIAVTVGTGATEMPTPGLAPVLPNP